MTDKRALKKKSKEEKKLRKKELEVLRNSFINVLDNPYKHLFFLNPRRVKKFFHGLASARERAIYGWCESDTYDIFPWFQYVFPYMLKSYAKHHWGLPNSIPGTDGMTEEELSQYWENYINEIAQHIINSSEDRCPKKNQYAEKFSDNYYREYTHEEEDGYIVCKIVEKDPEISKKFIEQEKEIYAYQCAEITKALDMLKPPVFFNLWD